MAKLEWKAPIEAVHGKLFKGFGAAKRTTPNAKGEVFNYSVFYGKRNLTLHPLSTDEVTHRTDFAAIMALYSARRADVTKRAQDAAGFKAQSTYTTLRSYIWSVCAAQYAASQEED